MIKTINICDRCEREVICLHKIPMFEPHSEMGWSEIEKRDVELCTVCATKYVNLIRNFMRREVGE